jgi:hypothetical protein
VWPSDQARWTMSHADVAPPVAAGNFGGQLHGRHAPQPASSMRPLPGTDHRLAAAHTCGTRISFGALPAVQRATALGRIDLTLLKGWVTPEEWVVSGGPNGTQRMESQ